MDNTKIFVDGMSFERPLRTAPKWVKGKLSLNVDKLIPFLQTHKTERGYVNVDLLESQKGTLYLALNTWKPTFEKKVDITDNDGITSDGTPSPAF